MAKPTEQVRAQVTESTGLGGDGSDDYGVPAGIDPTEDVLVAAGIFFGAPNNESPSDGTVAVYIDPSDGKLYFEDVENLGPGSRQSLADLALAGISAAQHLALDQLVHDVAETSFEEYTYTGTRVDAIIVWTDSGKTQKIRETLFTYTGNKATTIVTKQYDAAGTLVPTIGTLTETLSYTGNKLDDIDKVLS